MSTSKLRTTNELLESLDLWIPFLDKKNEHSLLKQAQMTRMKLAALETAELTNGDLTVEQEFVWDLCEKDFDQIESKINLLFINVQTEKSTTLH